eukprot:COSAG05_NODE_275_length_12406_cov_12.621841_6_plen_70_part_00
MIRKQAVTWQSDTVAVHWLTAGSKGFIDPIIYAAGMVLGSKRCAELARRHTGNARIQTVGRSQSCMVCN